MQFIELNFNEDFNIKQILKRRRSDGRLVSICPAIQYVSQFNQKNSRLENYFQRTEALWFYLCTRVRASEFYPTISKFLVNCTCEPECSLFGERKEGGHISSGTVAFPVSQFHYFFLIVAHICRHTEFPWNACTLEER